MTKTISETKPLTDFIRVAERYCDLIENTKHKTTIQLLQGVFVILPELCLFGMKLPDIKRMSEYEPTKRNQVHSPKLEKFLRQKLKTYDIYTDVFDPYDIENQKAIKHSISDDLSEIYFDIKPGLDEWSKANTAEKRTIVWDWKFGFEHHWGHHSTSLFRALFSLLFEHIEGKPELYIGIREEETENGGG